MAPAFFSPNSSTKVSRSVLVFESSSRKTNPFLARRGSSGSPASSVSVHSTRIPPPTSPARSGAYGTPPWPTQRPRNRRPSGPDGRVARRDVLVRPVPEVERVWLRCPEHLIEKLLILLSGGVDRIVVCEDDRSLAALRALGELGGEPLELRVRQSPLLVEEIRGLVGGIEADDLPPGQREAEVARLLMA